MTVLIIDDESFSRDFLADIVERMGYSTLKAESALEGKEILSSHPNISLIVTDIYMEGPSGLDFLRELRREGHALPIIVCSGNRDMAVTVEAMQSEANDYIIKDDNLEHSLMLSVNRVMEKQRLKDENARLMLELGERNSALSEANRKLAFMAETDSLTSLKNRRVFFEEFARHAALSERHGHSLSVIMIDIDYFKKFNDSFGHLEGDECLRRVSSILADNVREVDVLARYGGEEFVALLPETDRDGAMATAERMRRAVEVHQWELRPVTISVGVASRSLRAGSRHGSASLVSAIVEEADRALYASKDAGRNAVTFHAPDTV